MGEVEEDSDRSWLRVLGESPRVTVDDAGNIDPFVVRTSVPGGEYVLHCCVG